MNEANLKDVAVYVKDLLERGVEPKTIKLVLDVDGTLTNSSDPDMHTGALQPRGNAVKLVESWVNSGIKVVVSSAWSPFEETIQRLKTLGLGDILKITAGQVQQGEATLFRTSVAYSHLGLVASVRNKQGTYLPHAFYVDLNFYRLKAFAFKYAYPDLELRTIKHWVFADDSRDNASLFMRHISQVYSESQIEKATLPEGVAVKTFCLTMANGESFLE